MLAVHMAAGLLLGCGGAQHARDEKPAELRVVAVPESAVVRIDEQFAGAARVLASHPVRLRAGKKRITVEAPGYFPHDLEVDLPPGLTTIEIALRPVPP